MRVRGAFVLIFFLSGACALVYEVSWIRLFAVALGASAYSLCAVLAGFMAGLALGGAVAGRTADARRDPLRLYAVLELAISVLGFLSPEILEWLSRTLAPHLADPGMPMALRAVARFAVVAVVLVLPTSLMGATLPVLARGCVPEKDEVAPRPRACIRRTRWGRRWAPSWRVSSCSPSSASARRCAGPPPSTPPSAPLPWPWDAGSRLGCQ